MVAARVMVSASSISTSSSILVRTAATPLLKPNKLRPCFNTHNRIVSSKRFFTCRALYKSHVQIKEEGIPETLDYRVFFVDDSRKKISPWHDIPLHLGDKAFNFTVEIPKESSAKMEVATDEIYTPIKQDTKKGKLRYYPYNINWNYGLLPQTWEDPSFDVDGALTQGTLTAIRDLFRDYKIPDGKPANKFGLGNKAANKDYALKVIAETNESWAKLVKRSIPSGELSLV